MPSSNHYPQRLETLITALRRLPGVGARTAERYALAFMDWPEEELRQLGEQLMALKGSLKNCTICGNLSDGDVCRICSDSHRNREVICVVEQAGQVPVIERSGYFKGLYHVLGGRILPLEGKGPADIRIAELRQRIEAGGIRELILATNPDTEGEATAAYIAEEFRSLGVAITRIASGVPVGADIGFADAATMAVALRARHSLVAASVPLPPAVAVQSPVVTPPEATTPVVPAPASPPVTPAVS